MMHPDIPAEMPGINLERDLHTPSRMMICRKPSVTEQAAAARISAGLDAPQEDNAKTIGVDDSPSTDGGNNTNEGVTDEGVGSDESGDDDLPRITTDDDDSDSEEDNSDSDEDDANMEMAPLRIHKMKRMLTVKPVPCTGNPVGSLGSQTS